MDTLAQLYADIEDRVRAIRDDNHDWLCRLGCDGCCRRLAEKPRLTAAEWDLLREGLAALPPEQLREIGQDIAALAEVVWGNHDAIDRCLCDMGDTRDLPEWFAIWEEGGDIA